MGSGSGNGGEGSGPRRRVALDQFRLGQGGSVALVAGDGAEAGDEAAAFAQDRLRGAAAAGDAGAVGTAGPRAAIQHDAAGFTGGGERGGGPRTRAAYSAT